MTVGDMVRINEEEPVVFEEANGQIGVIVEMTKHRFGPAANVMVLGEVAEFDLDELEVINEGR